MPGVGISSMLSYLETEDFITRYNVNKNTIILKLDLNNLLEVNLINFYRYFFKNIVERIKQHPHITPEIKKEVESIYTNNIKEVDTFILYEELKALIETLSHNEFKLVIILDEFVKLKDVGKIAFNNLKAIRDINKESVSMFFIGSQNLPELLSSELLEGLYTIFRYKFLYVTPPKENEIHFIIKEQEDKFGIKVSEEDTKIIYKVSGGNLWYIKKIISLISESKNTLNKPFNEIINNLAGQYEIDIASEYLWNKLTKGDQDDITDVIKGSTQDFDNEYLLRSCIIIKENDHSFKVFSPIFESYIHKVNKIKTRNNDINASVNLKGRVITIDEKVVSSSLTKTEFNVLAYFIEHCNSIVSRDDIAQIMWGSDFYDNYSDYAIDRLISRVRKKIGENASAPKHLKTIKGVGFKFE